MSYEHIGQMISDKVKEYANQTAFKFKENNTWKSYTYAEFGEKIKLLSCALINADIKQGDTIGIYSPNRYEWAVTDFACCMAGAISVPIYSTNTKEQAEFIIKDAGIRLIFVGNEFQYSNLESIAPYVDPLKIISYDQSIKIDPASSLYFDDFLKIDISPEFNI